MQPPVPYPSGVIPSSPWLFFVTGRGSSGSLLCYYYSWYRGKPHDKNLTKKELELSPNALYIKRMPKMNTPKQLAHDVKLFSALRLAVVYTLHHNKDLPEDLSIIDVTMEEYVTLLEGLNKKLAQKKKKLAVALSP